MNANLPQGFDPAQEKEFKKSHDKYSQNLIYYASRIVKDDMTAEDIVAQVYIKLWEKRFQIEGHTWAFLTTCVKNACIDHLRSDETAKRKLEEWVSINPTSEPSPEDYRIDAELMDMINRFIQRLPPKYHQIFQKLCVEGKDVNTTIQELRIPLSTFYNRRSRLIDLIMNYLKRKNLRFFLSLTALLSGHYQN
jgi:RNA polymerase sigma factor (sigma-70 family)